MAKEVSLQNMFLEDIRDLLDAEKQLVRALPKMAKAATDDELDNALREHLEQTRGQVQRLQRVFEMMQERPRGKPCQGMKGIVQEGEEMLEQDQSEAMMDTAIAGAGRKVEHYEMASYESARAIAQQLGMREAAELLQETLREEMQADKTLAQISKRLMKEASRGETRETARGARRGAPVAPGRATPVTQTTTDHGEIRRWAEERDATPACVKGTRGRSNSCLIRLDFPGYTGEDSLEHISWDEWFENFDRNKLALIYRERTTSGQKSNFNKLVRRKRAGGRIARAAR